MSMDRSASQRKKQAMTNYAALDVSLEQTAICVVDGSGSRIAEAKVPPDPDAIAVWLAEKAGDLARIGMKTGPRRSGFGMN